MSQSSVTNIYLVIFPFLPFNRDYVTYMLTLVLLYLMFPALTMWSCYDSINKHFKKIHLSRVNQTSSSPLFMVTDVCL